MLKRETELSAIDRDALQRCYDTVRAQGPEQAAHLDHIEGTSGWRMAAESASFGLQCKRLKLKPWECPPSCTKDDEVDATIWGHKPKEIALRRRLLAAGLSLFEGDPEAALAAKARGAVDTSAA